MPNHLHGIVEIREFVGANGRIDKMFVGANGRSPEPEQLCGRSPFKMKPRSISSFVSGYKSAVTVQINKLRNVQYISVWQRNYYEHIIRNEYSLERIRTYIRNNPWKWKGDSKNL